MKTSVRELEGGKREKENDRSNGPITAILQILAKHP